VESPADVEETAVAAFWEAGCLGVESKSAARRRRRRGPGPMRLEAWFPGTARGAALRVQLRGRLAAAGLPPPALRRLDLRRVADGRWVETWQKTLTPMAIGRRLLAIPEDCPAPPLRGRFAIRIPFGQAFGTGEHASTRLVLRLLETLVRPGDRVLDLGTGTGILAVAALGLGAGEVLAIDTDPVAIAVARETLRRNGIASGITLRRDDAGAALGAGRFDRILVNIGATVIGRILPGLGRALAPGGTAILAGILIEDEPALTEAAGRSGLRVAGRRRLRPWSALVIEKALRS
jgi:ribosomal protein L11 methyltransferase